jgi:hypothetical protein
MHARTLSRARRPRHDHRLWEALERRDLLAAHLIADFFPLDTTTTWNYSGTVNGAPATAVATLSAGATLSGVATTRLATIFTPSGGGIATVDVRNYANTGTGLRLLREATTQGSLTSTSLFGDGISFLTASVDDGASIHFARSLSGSTSSGRAWNGGLTGDMTIVGLETIDTVGGSYEALKITLSETFTEAGSTGWTATGTVAETRWIVRGIGTVRVDYASSLISSDEGQSFFQFNLGLKSSSRLGDMSDLTVTGKGVVTPFGDTSPGAGDGTNFTGIDINGGTKTRIFKIQNTSGASITLAPGSQGFITIAGASAGEFTVVRQPVQTILPGQTALFSVRFDPAGQGFRFAAVSFTTTANTDHPFAFDIRGTGIFIGAINLTGGAGAAIANNDSTSQTQNGTAFGSVIASGAASVTRTFTISNSGVGTLVLLGTPRVLIGGASSSAFTVTTIPVAATAPGGSTTFAITFDPAALGAQGATVSIISNDRFNVVFSFAITGTGL